jgi:hypothetical protein
MSNLSSWAIIVLGAIPMLAIALTGLAQFGHLA